MKNKTQFNFFIIKRLDQEEKSDSLSNIYYLPVLNRIKETKSKNNKKIKNYFQNIIKDEKPKKISQNKKMSIIQVVKKTILSTNLSYKWRLISFKRTLIFFHIFMLLSGLSFNFKKQNIKDNASNEYINNINYTNVSLNDTHTFNSSFNYTNEFNNNSYVINKTNVGQEKIRHNNNYFFFNLIIDQILIIPIWYIYFFKYVPKRDKINNIIYKFTSYLLLHESIENNNYFFYLMKDYSILVTKKNHHLLVKSSKQFDYVPEKNIFLYCINIISDYLIEDYTKTNYLQLLSNEDKNYINILMKYISSNLNEKIKKYINGVLKPTIISLFISIVYYKNTIKYIILTLICVFFLLLSGQYLFKEYYRAYKQNIDLFIDNYNDILIPNKRFIYRKDKLIMFLALKDEISNKNQIIKTIEKIINN